MKTKQKGFTLVEVLIVTLILGVLAFIAIPRFNLDSIQTARINTCRTNVAILNTQIELYALDNNGVYPTNLRTLTENYNYFPDGSPLCPITGKQYPNRINNNHYRVNVVEHNQDHID